MFVIKKVTRNQIIFMYDSGAKPVLWVKPGERILVETWDCRKGLIRKKSDLPEASLWRTKVPGMPLTGPIYVEGAEKGDTLAVEIEEITPTEIPGFVSLKPPGLMEAPSGSSREPNQDTIIKIYHAKEGKIHYEGGTLPYRPMIGSIGTAPEYEALGTSSPGRHGGNLDLPDVSPGSTIYLPVFVEGGYLSLGDTHAIQGDGEITGTGVEMSADVVLRINLLKGKRINWPRVETTTDLIAVGIAKPLEAAVRLAYRELILWLEEDFDMDRWDSYILASLLGKLRIGQIVNPLYTVAALYPKEYLAKARASSNR
jgi:acetamidase/formamidase